MDTGIVEGALDDQKQRIGKVGIIGNRGVNIAAMAQCHVCHAHALIIVLKVLHGAIY